MRASEAIRRIVTVEWPKAQERQAKALLLRTARAGHARIMADARANGSEPTFEAYANAAGNPRLDTVVLPGPIVYNYFYHRRVVVEALRLLREMSPRGPSGRYRETHTVYVDGVPQVGLPQNLKWGDEIVIANPLPYARRLEIGKTESGRDFLISVPNRIYERAARTLKVQFGRNTKISFGYITPPSAARLTKNNAARSWLAGKGRWHAAPGQRADRARGAAIRSPAIFIEI